jgi:uncharacterized protein YdiU (UPF0061 family)
MSNLTPEQEAALATFKENLHLPNGGFHTLITELGKEYQLPFQKVRSVVKQAQKNVERRIKSDFETIDADALTQANWIAAIRAELEELAKETESVMDKLKANPKYLNVSAAIEGVISTEDERDEWIEQLIQVYEKEVLKPLLAMLRTTKLYWTLMLVDETCKMTPEQREKFADYPQHMEAAEHLYELDKKLRAKALTE